MFRTELYQIIKALQFKFSLPLPLIDFEFSSLSSICTYDLCQYEILCECDHGKFLINTYDLVKLEIASTCQMYNVLYKQEILLIKHN